MPEPSSNNTDDVVAHAGHVRPCDLDRGDKRGRFQSEEFFF